MSRETVACVTTATGALERPEKLLLRAEPHPLDEARDEPLALRLRERRDPSA